MRPSVELARAAAAREGVADRITFEVAPAKAYPGKDYATWWRSSIACTTWAIRTGAASYVRGTLKPDGTWMIVEPFAGDTPETNHNVFGRVFYSASTLVCVPASLSQEVGAALGAQAGEKALKRSCESRRIYPFPEGGGNRRSQPGIVEAKTFLERKKRNMQRTFAIIKPDAVAAGPKAKSSP